MWERVHGNRKEAQTHINALLVEGLDDHPRLGSNRVCHSHKADDFRCSGDKHGCLALTLEHLERVLRRKCNLGERVCDVSKGSRNFVPLFSQPHREIAELHESCVSDVDLLLINLALEAEAWNGLCIRAAG